MFGKATVFMSHCWGGRFGDLVGAACHRASMDRIVWIDIFAVRQWPGNLCDLNFRSVIERSEAMVVSTLPVNGLSEISLFNEERDAFSLPNKEKQQKSSCLSADSGASSRWLLVLTGTRTSSSSVAK